MQEETTQRTSLLRKNIFVSFFLKGWSGIIYFLLVPLTLACLGEYRNGLWMAISSLLVWIDTFDIGLGNGLRNKLATYVAQGDTQRAHEAVSTTFFMLIIIIVPVALILISSLHFVNLYGLLNADPTRVADLDRVVAASLILVCGTFIFKFVGNVYTALQLPAINNLLQTGGQTLVLFFTWLVWRSETHSLMHIALANTLGPLLVYLLAYPITFFKRYPNFRPRLSCINLRSVGDLLGIGIKFFFLQISSVLLFMSSNIIISNLYSPAAVTDYQIAYRYFSLLLILFTIISTPYWSATTDAWEQGDIAWIMKSQRNIRHILMGLAVVCVLMILGANWFYRLWVGSEIHIPLSLTLATAAYVYILIFSLGFSNFINGIGTLRLQLIFTIGTALVFIPLCWVSARIIGEVWSVPFTMIIILIPGTIVNIIQYYKLSHGTAKGIWKK